MIYVLTLIHDTCYSPPGSAGGDIPELQLEYWVANRAPSAGDKAKNALTKETLKGYFKFVQITRGKSSFKLVAATREKKGKSKYAYIHYVGYYTKLTIKSIRSIMANQDHYLQ